MVWLVDGMIEKGNRIAKHLEAIMSRTPYVDLAIRSRRDCMVRVKQVIRDGKNIKTTLYEQYVEPFRDSSKDHVAFANLTKLSTSAFVKKYKLNNCTPDMMDYATYVATEEFNIKFTEMSNTPQTDYNPEIVDKLFF